MEKIFVIYWDETYNNKNQSVVVDLNFFGNFNGFDITEIKAVKRIDVGETIAMDGNHVWVMRVK